MKKKAKINKFEKIMSKKTWIIFEVFLIILSIAFIVISLKDCIKLYIVRTYEITTADVIDANFTYNPYNKPGNWYPKYEYKYAVKGQEYQSSDIINTTGIIDHISKDKNKIKILYKKNNPKISDVFYISYQDLIISVLSIVLSIIIGIKIKKWEKKNEHA